MNRWIVWSAASACVLGGMAWASVTQHDPEWAALSRSALCELRSARERGGCPPVGEARDGESWQELRHAVGAVQRWPAGVEDRVQQALLASAPVPEELLLATGDAVLAVGAAAACRRDGPGAYDMLPLLRAFEALRLHARAAARSDADAALDLIQAGIAAAADAWSLGAGIEQIGGAHAVAGLVDEVGDALLAGASPAALRRFADGLAACDAALPPPADYLPRVAAHVVVQIATCRDVADLGVPLPSTWRLWRTGFSATAYLQAEVGLMVRALHTTLDATAGPDVPWEERRPALDRMDRWNGRVPHSIGFGSALSGECELRTALAQLRLLRLAVAHHLGQEPPQLRDPLGAGPLPATSAEAGSGGLLFTSAEPGVQRLACRREH